MIVSFDVGLRNLAFCVLESPTKIREWGVIDVMADGETIVCFKCKKPAAWKCQDKYACTLHKGKTFTKTLLTKKSLEELKKEAGSLKIEGKTKKALVDGIYAHYSTNAWNRCVKSCKQGSVVDLAPIISNALKARTSLWVGAQEIIFEQQPDKRMMAVQAMMHMWFVCHGYKVKGVSAKHKLTNIVTLEDSTSTYKGRKKTGILHTEKLCPPEWIEYFRKHHKKDDLADCFLQGLWYIQK
jgi:hypothetical protein